jgi:GTPase SAR1 family protein
MTHLSNISLEQGLQNLSAIPQRYRAKITEWNEAETRFHFIDELLTTCLGWPRDHINVERHIGGEYADYILGNPGRLIIEAKREGTHFDLPAGSRSKLIVSLPSLLASSKSCKAAVEQVQRYCSGHGVEFAAVCNGPQLIAFIGVRIGEPPLSGKALTIHDLDGLLENFPLVWNHLSPDGVAERRLYRLLTTGTTAFLPPKPSTRLVTFPKVRYQSQLQANLRDFSELLIEDVVHADELEKQFYEECYCDTGALSRDALLSKKILAGRYAALFPTYEKTPRLHQVDTNSEGRQAFTDDVMQEALARRPIVLLGDVGVGKTSFIKSLILMKAYDEFANSIFLYLDLGSQGSLATDIRGFIIDDIGRQLYAKYAVDIEDARLVQGVYDAEVRRFRTSIYSRGNEQSDEKDDAVLQQMLAKRVDDKPEHLRRVVDHLAKARRKQIVVIIDNADQRPVQVQQEAFIIAQDFARNWNALAFIAVRPQTFFQSKRAGAFSAYPHRIFTISPPRPEIVIEKRLQFALKICAGEITPAAYPGLTLRVGNMSLFLQALLDSLRTNREIKELLANITGGNIREAINYVKGFIGSPNVNAEKIVEIMARTGRCTIPLHEFSKAAILGDYSHFNPESSLATNLFDVEYADEREHFLGAVILGYLESRQVPKDKDGFTVVAAILQEMAQIGVLEQQTEGCLRGLTNKKLIETTERVTFEESAGGLVGDLPFAFRLTTIGAYHLHRWLGSFGYLDAMVFDTPIFDEKVFESMLYGLEDFHIDTRLERAKVFRQYLTSVWNKAGIEVPYFDWMYARRRGELSFAQVERAVERQQPAEGEI